VGRGYGYCGRTFRGRVLISGIHFMVVRTGETEFVLLGKHITELGRRPQSNEYYAAS
jgi:hypothetical protein